MYARMRELMKGVVPRSNRIYNYLNGFRTRPLNPFWQTGFHGDPYLTSLMFHCLGKAEQFIETGSSVGASLMHVAKSFPTLRIYSCEPDKAAFTFTATATAHFKNVLLLKKTSPEFLYYIEKLEPEVITKETAFWLDSHGMGFKWPLRDEVKHVTETFPTGYLFIDDFLVPEGPQFGYSTYDTQICSLDYIRNSLDRSKTYNLFLSDVPLGSRFV